MMNIEQALDGMQGSLTRLREGIRKLGVAGTAGDPIREKEKYREWLYDEMSAIPDFLKGKLDEAKTATEIQIEHAVESYDLFQWLAGRTDKKPVLADKVLEKLLSSTKAADLERESLKFMREFFKAHPDIIQAVKPEDMFCPIYGNGFAESPTVPGTVKEATPDLPLNARVAKALRKWVVYDPKDGWGYIELGNEFHEIADYPNDLVAIVEAAEAIAKKYEVDIWIRIKDGLFLVNIQKEHTVLCSAESECLPEAICLAIVKDAEVK